jgi:transposase
MRTDQTFTTRGEEVVLAVSLELAAAKWKVALHDGRREKPAVHTVAQPQAAARPADRNRMDLAALSAWQCISEMV